MSTESVGLYHCGAYSPGYLKQASVEEPDYEAAIPTTLGQEVNATVCWPGTKRPFHFYKPCKRQTEIKIKKCLGYFIYNLPTPIGNANWYCDYVYCGQ